MVVRAVEGKKLWTGGNAVEVDNEQKTIRLRLRDENNLIIYDVGDDEIYTDLQLNNEVRPTDAFPVGVTTGRVIVDNGWDVTGTILIFKTTSGDYVELLYGDDGKLYIDNGTGSLKQIYLKGEVDALLALKQDLLTAGYGISIDANNEISNTLPGPIVSDTAPDTASQGDLWYDTTIDILKAYDGTNWNEVRVESNTKTFYLSSTSDLTNAQAVYDWYAIGKNPTISYNSCLYTLDGATSSRLTFKGGIAQQNQNSSSFIGQDVIYINISSDTVTSIDLDLIVIGGSYLRLGQNYTTPYTPTNDGDPTSKKYVDEHGPNIPVYYYNGDFNNDITFNMIEAGEYRLYVRAYHGTTVDKTLTLTVDSVTVGALTSNLIEHLNASINFTASAGSTVVLSVSSKTNFTIQEVYIEKVNIQSGYLTATVN